MEITIACPCGEKFTRNEGSAGLKWKCACGQDLQVPTLAELRRMSGELEDPERLIRAGLDDRDLFPDRACCRCQVRTDDWLPVMIECEPGNFDPGGVVAWKTVLTFPLAVFSLIGVWGMLFGVRGDSKGSYGKGYRVPLLLCPECQKALNKQTLLESLRSVPVYDRLLNKYPEANVYSVAR